MHIIDINEAGANNILMWALSNGANIKEDIPLTGLINDELFYLVRLGNVNFFELFRLTQMYRDKIRICQEYQAEVPSRKELNTLFPGEYFPVKEDTEKSVPLYEVTEHTIQTFMNLVTQMAADDDIIPAGAARLFLPMISRKFDIQIPVAFADIIECMTPEESERVFGVGYPDTLKYITEEESHSVKRIILIGFMKSTQILKYEARYDKYLKAIKYAPLKTYTGTGLYKFGLIGFFKRDNVSRSEIRCSLFKSNTTAMNEALKKISRLTTPLELDFVIQLPIHYMQLLQNSFGRDILPISYQSSMSTIIDNGMRYDDFKLSDINEDTEDPEQQATLENHNTNIESYRIRITEANQILLNTVPIVMESESAVDITGVFSMFPSIYMANAVISVSTEHISKLVGHSDPLLSDMFEEISDSIIKINEDLHKVIK